MSKGLSVELNNFKSQITLQLEAKGLLFLIKTEDHFFDDFLITKLISTNLFEPKRLKKDLSELKAWKNEVQDLNACHLIEIPKITGEIIEYLSEQVSSQDKNSLLKVAYLLPKNITQKFFDIPEREAFFSSCVFFSEQVPFLASDVLEEELATIFGNQLSSSSTSFFLKNSQNKTASLGKLHFFAQHLKNELGKGGDLDANQIDQGYLFQFIEYIGSEFISSADLQVSLDNLQVFFRSFIYVDGIIANSIELEYVEVQSYSLLPNEQLDFIFSLATSEKYHILSEREGAFRFAIPEFLTEWSELKRWVANEETSFKQFKQLKVFAADYFSGSGTLLSKEQVDQATTLKDEIFTTYNWEKKYNIDQELISSYLLLSQNHLEEQIRTQQKKRISLLRTSIRISIAVGIAFLLSSFAGLWAYIQRNEAVNLKDIAVKAQVEAVEAKGLAEKQREEAVKAQKNEELAKKEAVAGRLEALSAREDAEVQRTRAVDNLVLARISEEQASIAKDEALKSAQVAKEATINAENNYQESEKLRKREEARASALEALGYFTNRDFARGIDLVKGAYQKNLSYGGFPLQSDIFNALLNGLYSSKVAEMEINLEFPAKLFALSEAKDKLAVYTINRELRVYATLPSLKEMPGVIKTDYIKSFEFLSDTEIIGTNINGSLFLIDLTTATFGDLATKLPVAQIKGFSKVFGPANTWIAKQADGSKVFYQYGEKGFVAIKEEQAKLLANELSKPMFWIEGNEFYKLSLMGISELVVKAPSTIHSAAWSVIHSRWMLGLENGNILSIDPANPKVAESFKIHDSKVSQLVTMPYAHGTELMLSTGFDKALIFFVLGNEIPLSASVSSRIKFEGHRSWITGFTVDEKKKIAYSISNDRTLKVWPLEINELFQK